VPCNCGKRANNLTPDSRFLTQAYPSPAEDDMIVLQADTECETLYTGIYRQATIFVVAYATPNEVLFPRRDRTKALRYAQEEKLTFDQVPAGALCHDVVVELLGA
jgi:hypothetical protein